MVLAAETPKQDLTDEALWLLVIARKALPAPTNRPSLRVRGRTGDFTAIQREAVFFRLVSIVEAYTDALMIQLMRTGVPPRNGLVERMIGELEQSVSRGGWSQRQGAFIRLHGVRFSDFSAWKRLEAAAHVRNSIAHGLGRLTPSQRRNAEMPAKVGLIGVEVRGDRFVLNDASLLLTFEACREFIRALDAAS